MSKFEESKNIRCSFCGKPQSMVDRLIAGNGSYICDECVRLCMSIIDEGYDAQRGAASAKKTSAADFGLRADELPRPADIKKILDD